NDLDDGGLFWGATHGLYFDLSLPTVRNNDGPGSIERRTQICAYVTLHPTSRIVEIKVVGDNSGFNNHRLRALFPTGLKGATHSYAEQAFDVVARPISVPDGTGWKEPPHGRHPMKSFVDVSDGRNGFALITKGLPQYEVLDDEPRTLALTLLRATGNG